MSFLSERHRLRANWRVVPELTRTSILVLAGIFGLAAAYVAFAIPYGSADALSYGKWSRLISEHGHFWFPTVSDASYHLPLFYVLQGWVWWFAGFDERYGEFLSLAFAILLVASLALVAAEGRNGRTRWAIVVGLALATPILADQAVGGLTDVPAAATTAALAASIWVGYPSASRAPLIALAAAAAVLAKPDTLPAIAGLMAAAAIGPRGDLAARIRKQVAPITVGVALALVYDEVGARHFHEGLIQFLRAGSTGYYANLANHARRGILLDQSWLGSANLRALLIYSVAYPVGRFLLRRHVRAVLAAWVLAMGWSYYGPWLAIHQATNKVGPFTSGTTLAIWLGTGLVLLGSLACREADLPQSLDLGRLLLWGTPPTVAWIVAGGYDARLLSPAWPALLLLMASALTTAFNGLSRRIIALGAAPLALVFTLALLNFYSVGGLQGFGWHDVRSLGWSAFDRDKTAPIALRDFPAELTTVQHQLGPHGRLFTSDERFGLFLGDRVTQSYPSGCSSLIGYRVFILLTDSGSAEYLQQSQHVPATAAFWEHCTTPHLTMIETSPSYIIFRVSG